MKSNDFNLLRYELERCIELYKSRVLHSRDSIFAQSAFIEILIRLNDILQFLKKMGQGISFTDDVSGKGVKDITDLVNKLRNAACHDRTSNEAKIGNAQFIFNRIIGRIPNAIRIGSDIRLGSDYDDDIAFFYGDKRIYLSRHIERLLNELKNRLDQFKL